MDGVDPRLPCPGHVAHIALAQALGVQGRGAERAGGGGLGSLLPPRVSKAGGTTWVGWAALWGGGEARLGQGNGGELVGCAGPAWHWRAAVPSDWWTASGGSRRKAERALRRSWGVARVGRRERKAGQQGRGGKDELAQEKTTGFFYFW